MMNLFEDVKIKPDLELAESDHEQQLKLAKREEIYQKYDPMVNELLDMLIAVKSPGVWKKGSDCERLYCCHIAWYAGPEEKYKDPYDIHHKIRRRLEIKLEMDGLCNPTGFQVIHYEAINKIIRVGLEKDDLVRGIKAVME